MNRDFVRNLIVEESFSYGFTIAFWGSGLLLINEFGLLHTLGIIENASGAITGFEALAVATFGGAVDTVDVDASPSYFILAGIHYLSGLVPVGITHGLIAIALGKTMTLLLTGMAVSICYNVFATFEEVLSEMAWRAEQTVLDE